MAANDDGGKVKRWQNGQREAWTTEWTGARLPGSGDRPRYVYLKVLINTDRERQRHRQTETDRESEDRERQTDRETETDTQRGRQTETDRQTDRQTASMTEGGCRWGRAVRLSSADDQHLGPCSGLIS